MERDRGETSSELLGGNNMILDYGLDDDSANLSRKILTRGIHNLEIFFNKLFGNSEFVYVACPDFSITLRQKRLILGFPIGGYIRWPSKYNIFPLDLDVNTCGVHILKLPDNFNEYDFIRRLYNLKQKLDNQKLMLDGKVLKWNFSIRNHFINVYKDQENNHYLVVHSSGETELIDIKNLNKLFDIKYIDIENRKYPYIIDSDAIEYAKISAAENDFFYKRHKFIFNELFHEEYELIYSNLHFGMIKNGEVLMGCSKLQIGSKFPILTNAFDNIVIAQVNNPPKDMLDCTNGYALVPHGLGMRILNDITDIRPYSNWPEHVEIVHKDKSIMVTNTLEYMGIDYRKNEIIPIMAEKVGFKIIKELIPVTCIKL